MMARRSSLLSIMAIVAMAWVTLACGGRRATAAPSLASPQAASSAIPAPDASTPQLLWGTLDTAPSHAKTEYAAGIQVAHLELGWDQYEPDRGQFSDGYASEMRARLRVFQDAGMLVVLGIGLQYPPSWVLNSQESRYVNQYGETASAANLTFNQPLRDEAARYIARVDQDLGLRSFWAIRVGSGGLIESLYPSGRNAAHPNSYWAFDVNAQAGIARPPSIPSPPYPGWKPGERTYQGRPFTTAQVREWYDWYLRALTDGIVWQMDVYRSLGYDGLLQVLMPGVGARPMERDASIANYLWADADQWDNTVARGAAWDTLVEWLHDQPNLVVYVSSVADGSGNNDTCRPGDMDVDPHSNAVLSWSATRWLTYNAQRFALPIQGENPGEGHAPGYGASMLAAAARQAQSCHLRALLWAHDEDLYDPNSGISLRDYTDTIAAWR
jgi:hypothetical protein